jgi:hypothetical protein
VVDRLEAFAAEWSRLGDGEGITLRWDIRR